MHAANGHFQARRYTAALSDHDRAVALIDELLTGSRPCAGLVMAKIVSHHNRANALVCVDRFSDADADFEAAWAFARAVADDAPLSVGLREAARRHCAVCYNEWQDFRTRRASSTQLDRVVVH